MSGGARWIAGLVVVATTASGCASTPPESPWAGGPDIADLPTPTPATDPDKPDTDRATATADPDRATDATASLGAVLMESECHEEEIRCGLVAVPQLDDAPDLVTLEFRILAEEGDQTPVVQLLDGTADELADPDTLPDRSIVLLGSRGLAPGGPSLTCPEFWQTDVDAAIAPVITACRERLERAGIHPEGTVPNQLGADVGLAIRALGYEEVDLVVPRWRAVTVPAIAASVGVRRVVYADPWFGAARPAAWKAMSWRWTT